MPLERPPLRKNLNGSGVCSRSGAAAGRSRKRNAAGKGGGPGENNGAKNDSGDFGEFHAEPNRLLSALSYLSVLFILPFLLCPNDPFARFHAKQGAVLFGFGVLADVVGKIIPIGWVLTLFRLYCIYKGMSSLSQGAGEPPALHRQVRHDVRLFCTINCQRTTRFRA